MEIYGDSRFATGEEFEGQGYRVNKIGYDYQEAQFIRFALNASRIERLPFHLASDVGAGGKFDDIFIVRPGLEGGGRSIRCIQVKHVQNPDKKKVTPSNLLSEKHKEPFTLQKYFVSYVNIKKNKSPGGLIRPDDSIEDLVILTNTGFAFGEKHGSLELREDIFEDLGIDSLFSKHTFRFKPVFPGRRELVLTLKKGIIDMPHEFAICVKDGKPFNYKVKDKDLSEGGLHSKYRTALNTEVLSGSGDKFSDDFVMDRNLSQYARHFRQELYSKYPRSDENEESFRAYLIKETIVPLDEIYARERSDPGNNTEILVDLDSEVDEFLGKLKFVVNQSGYEDTVQHSIKDLADRFDREEGDPMVKMAYSSLRVEVNDWMRGKKARCLTKSDLERFFSYCHRLIQVHTLISTFQPAVDRIQGWGEYLHFLLRMANYTA